MPKWEIAISVIMAAYNAEKDVETGINSILKQSFKDFEFIIINDGSSDSTSEILEKYAGQDSRIKLIHQENTGLTIALNKALKLARGKYVARQDADDTSYTSRLQKQFELMETNPCILLCGANCDDLYDDGAKGSWGWYDNDKLQKIVFFKTPFAHSTAFMRTDTARELGGYDESFRTSQDMEFWMRFAKAGQIAMIREPLIERKITDGSISSRRRWRQFHDGLRARLKHNTGPFRKSLAIFHAFRSLLIGLLPHKIALFLARINRNIKRKVRGFLDEEI